MAHTDGPAYAPIVATLSLGSHAILHLVPRTLSDASTGTTPTVGSDQATKVSVFLPARSLIVLSETMYSDWMHSIEAIKVDSIESLMSTVNWDVYWQSGGDLQSSAMLESQPGSADRAEGSVMSDGIQKTSKLDKDKLIAEVVTRRRFTELGKGWERSTRLSLTCRRVEKVRKAFKIG